MPRHCQQELPTTLPDGTPVPVTAAGRRVAARIGGAEAAAIASAAAREALRQERRGLCDGPLGDGPAVKIEGDVKQMNPDGYMPIGANPIPQKSADRVTYIGA